AAWRGVDAWLTIFANLNDLAGHLMDSGTALDTALSLEHTVSVREYTYKGVDYLRVRMAPNVDLGIAVVNGHLVIGTPVGSLLEAVDVGRIGLPIIDRAARLTDVGGVAEQVRGGSLVGYSVVNTPAFMYGLARIADLASSGIASGLWLGGIGAAEWQLPAGAAALPPSYDDALVLTELFVDALELLADKFGIAVGTASVMDDARWTTWRLPFAE